MECCQAVRFSQLDQQIQWNPSQNISSLWILTNWFQSLVERYEGHYKQTIHRSADHSGGGQPWDFFGGNDAEAETPVLWPPHAKSWIIGKDPEDWRQEEKGWEWDGWMASLTRWTWVWMNSGSWWWTERPGVLWFTGSQRVRHDWATELNWRRETGQSKKGKGLKAERIRHHSPHKGILVIAKTR